MENINKTILIIGAGPGQVPAILKSREMGVYAVTIDLNPNSEGFKYANEYEIISTKDIDKVVKYAVEFNEKRKLNGVMTCGAEVSQTVSAVAERLDLPGISVEVAKNATNKLRRQSLFKKYKVLSPKFFPIKSINELEKIKDSITFPVVIKPIDKAGATGVKKCNNFSELIDNFYEVKSVSDSDTIIVEEFLHGIQISTESIVYNGKIYTTGFADRNYDKIEEFLPYFIEDGHTIPSLIDEKTKQLVLREIEKAIKALGINWGVAKGDVIISNGKPMILEMASRLSGGRFATDMVPLATGVDIVKTIIKMSIGENINIENEVKQKFNKAAAQRFFLHKRSGIVKSLSGINEAKNSKGVFDLMIERNIKKGDKINIIKSHHDRILHVIAVGNNRDEAVENAENAISKIKLEYE